MRYRNRFVSIAAVAFFLAVSTLATAGTFEPLGFLPNTDHSFARAISADGSVVVGASANLYGYLGLHGGYREAFRWSAQDGLQGLGDFAGGEFDSVATGISADGSVIVGGGYSEIGSMAFRWTAQAGGVAIPPPAPYQNSEAEAVSRDGQVITGTSFGGPSQSGTDFRIMQWRASTGSISLELPSDYEYATHPKASGDGSVVVGGAIVATDGSGAAFRWTAATGMRPLTALDSNAEAISADGHVIAGIVVGGGLTIWRDDGTVQNAGELLSYYTDVRAQAMVPDGSIIVGAAQVSGSHYHAFIWDQENGMRDLNQVLVSDYGVNLNGWTLEWATAISDNGLFIAGEGTNPAGQWEAWLVALPEPALASLMVPFAIVSACRRRRRPETLCWPNF